MESTYEESHDKDHDSDSVVDLFFKMLGVEPAIAKRSMFFGFAFGSTGTLLGFVVASEKLGSPESFTASAVGALTGSLVGCAVILATSNFRINRETPKEKFAIAEQK